jgi:hypothetical protein
VTRAEAGEALRKALLAWDGQGAWPWPRSPNDGPARAAVLVTRNLAVELDGKPALAMTTDFAVPRAVGADARTDAIDLAAIATPVDTKQAGSCGGYRVVEGSGDLHNVLYVFGLEVIVRDARGVEVARRTFPAPTGPLQRLCPDSLAGRDGKTVLLVAGPPSRPILDWLDDVRRGPHPR